MATYKTVALLPKFKYLVDVISYTTFNFWALVYKRSIVLFIIGFALVLILIPLPAIKMDYPSPGNLGKQSKELPNSKVEFGEKQLVKMLEDRPTMKQFVTKNDKIWDLTKRYFAGELCNQKVHWNPEVPIDCLSNCRYPTTNRNQCFIRLQDKENGIPVKGEFLWSALIFEFYNLASSNDFLNLHKTGLAGKLSKEEWVKKHAEIEYRAVVLSADFYHKIWIPHMKQKGIPTNSKIWLEYRSYDPKFDFNAWYSQFKDKNEWPYDVWGRYYDNKIVPYLRSKKLKEI